MFEKKKLWYISCHTGCSCCADENFDQGLIDGVEGTEIPLPLSMLHMADITLKKLRQNFCPTVEPLLTGQYLNLMK